MNESNKKFPMEYDPVDYVISVHIRNLVETFGKDKVKEIFTDLFNFDKKENEQKVSNE